MPRRDPVQDPSQWTLLYRDRQAEVGWKACIKQQPAKALGAYNAIRTDPRRMDLTQYRLKSDLGTGLQDGKALERWQYRLSSGGRLWYLIDDDAHVLWLDYATLHHPKPTQ